MQSFRLGKAEFYSRKSAIQLCALSISTYVADDWVGPRRSIFLWHSRTIGLSCETPVVHSQANGVRIAGWQTQNKAATKTGSFRNTAFRRTTKAKSRASFFTLSQYSQTIARRASADGRDSRRSNRCSTYALRRSMVPH